MRFILIIIAAIALITLGKKAYSQTILSPEHIVLEGVIMDAETDSLLIFANVFNRKTHRGVLSDTMGYFKFFGLSYDTITFSSMGYISKRYPLPDTSGLSITDTIRLTRQKYSLPEVEIVDLTPYEQLRMEVKNMEVPRDLEYARMNLTYENANYLSNYSREPGTVGLQIGGPITALYNAFSKEGKDQRKAIEMQKEENIAISIEPKYSKRRVMAITGLNEQLAVEFMKFCDFSNDFLLNAEEYYIIEVLLEHYKEFCVVHNITPNKD